MIRGVEVGSDYETTQRSFDGQLSGIYGSASGLGDLTREQVKQMRIAERKRFARGVVTIFMIVFGMAWIANDLTHFGDLINLPF